MENVLRPINKLIRCGQFGRDFLKFFSKLSSINCTSSPLYPSSSSVHQTEKKKIMLMFSPLLMDGESHVVTLRAQEMEREREREREEKRAATIRRSNHKSTTLGPFQCCVGRSSCIECSKIRGVRTVNVAAAAAVVVTAIASRNKRSPSSWRIFQFLAPPRVTLPIAPLSLLVRQMRLMMDVDQAPV